MTTVKGQIIDSATGHPVPFATVELWFDNIKLASAVADESGFFVVESQSSPDSLILTSASYLPVKFSLPDSTLGPVFMMQPNVKTGENVIVTAVKKNPVFLGLIIIALLLASKR